MKRGPLEGPDPAFPEESAEELYEGAPCGYLSTLLDGTIVRMNQTLLDWTGYGREEVIGRMRFPEMLPMGDRMYYETHLSPLLQMQGSVREIAVDLLAAGGKSIPVLVSSVLKRDGTGEPALIRTTVFSARDRREYERELLRARERAEESENKARALARTLQKSFIPPATPEIPGLDIAGVYRPAGDGDEVGGDFYDVFETPGGDWAVVLGDVAGKGVEAAGVTALARYTVRAAAIRTTKPGEVLEILNQALLQQGATRFCTAVLCRIHKTEESKMRISLAVGGHPLPFLVRPGVEAVPVGHPGTLLGSFEDPVLEETTLELAPGDLLFLFSDGLTEGRRGKEFFGENRLKASLQTLSDRTADEIAKAVASEVVDFQEGFPRDDMAIVALKAI